MILLDLMNDADSYVCHWQNGELFIVQDDASR